MPLSPGAGVLRGLFLRAGCLCQRLSIFPQQPTLDTFRYLLSQKMNILIQGYGMTIFITLVGTACSLAITLMYAFAISMPRLPPRQQVFLFRLFHHAV